MSRTQSTSSRKLRVEALEARRLLATDVINGTLVDHTEVIPFLAAGDVGGGVLEPGTVFAPTYGSHSTLRRASDSVSYDLHTTGLPPGAYTVWIVAFNNPDACIDGCNEEDLLRAEPNPSLFWSTGGVVGDDGVGDFHGQANQGEMPSQPGQSIIGTDGIVDARQAEIHLVVKYHGAASEVPAVLEGQLTTLLGSCIENANAIDFGPDTFGVQCFDPQVAVHKPLSLPGDLSDDGVLNQADIDLLSAAVVAGSGDARLDLNQDASIDDGDRVFLIDELMAIPAGDADLDGDVDFADFVSLSAAFGGEGGWAQGDFDGSGMVDFDDFVLLSDQFGTRIDRTEVVPFLPAGDVGGGVLGPGTLYAPTATGRSTLHRGTDGVSYDLQTTGLPPGAYTVWVVAFNNPAECIDGCDAGDLLLPDSNPSLFWSAGGVVGEDGIGAFQGQINEGEMPSEPGQSIIGADGIADAQTSDVHLVVKYHGPASDDPAVLEEQLSTLLGSCTESANAIDFGPETFGLQCFDPQVAVHEA